MWLCYISISVGNPLLLNSSMQPDLTVGRTYSTPLCFQDNADKELFDALPDIKVKVQSSFMVSLGVAERAEFHAKAPAETFPRDLSRDYSSTVDRRKKGLLTLNGPFSTCKEQLRITGIFGHSGGRLVVPNTGEKRKVCEQKEEKKYCLSHKTSWKAPVYDHTLKTVIKHYRCDL